MLELAALKDIIFESGAEASIKNKKTSGLRGLSLAQQFSKLHYEDSDKSFTTDVIYDLKTFTLEIVALRIDEIRESFENEKLEIEREIDRLNDSLDGDYGADAANESDSKISKTMSKLTIHAVPVPLSLSTEMDMCSVCSSRRPANLLFQRGSSSGFICATCETMRNKREAKMGTVNSTNKVNGGLSHSRSTPVVTSLNEDTHLSSPPQRDVRRNNNEDSPDSARTQSPRGGASSKFRNRIDSARHEHHFIDEF